ncbi:hypothetical protein EVAR_59450_1 [Eumeta japonica]|uniref:Uncharacterized protein n=1 Tax=Eumeta variegata TaxID=151549 RepID=A0A4C1Z497_EUMVA|nr:hypothetical protein EVAR_59450_1 [Eumeta japonica]
MDSCIEIEIDTGNKIESQDRKIEIQTGVKIEYTPKPASEFPSRRYVIELEPLTCHVAAAVSAVVFYDREHVKGDRICFTVCSRVRRYLRRA